jgi:mevalonate kinase
MTAEELAAIPSRALPLVAHAPGKCILFGEHAVVHGKPELLLAIDLFTQIAARPAASTRLNADVDPASTNPYLAQALARLWEGGPPLALDAISRIPRAAGLGSSAAFVASLASILTAARGGTTRAQLAQLTFDIERTAQGVGSPGDTTAVVGGGYVAINDATGAPLWEVRDGERRWEARRVADPGWTWIVAYSGVRRNTGRTVQEVGRRLAEPDGPGLLEEFESVARQGIEAVAREDRGATGRLLDRNQELLRTLGVSHPRLEALLDAVRPACEGAKLTGAGAGGSIVVLPKLGRELEASRRISSAGGVPYPVRPVPAGAALLEPPAAAPADED